MALDAQTIRRAVFDLFRFNPKDFFVQGSHTGFLVSIAKQSSQAVNNDFPFKLVDQSNSDDGFQLKVILDSWLNGSYNPDDKLTITGLDAPFAISGDVDQFIYIEATFDDSEVFSGASILAADWNDDSWTGDDLSFPVEWDEPTEPTKKQIAARRLIGFTIDEDDDRAPFYPNKFRITTGTGDDAQSLWVVQSLKSNLVLCEDCFETDSVRMLKDFSQVPYIPAP